MAKLMKLQICGIRSFGPYEEHNQSLSFGSPVTLILGQNGSGKTTIIESIKFACTGELPSGTNNGQGFVNDPKISGTSSTKGRILLKFQDPRDNEITVSRVVEVSRTATSMSFKNKNPTIRKVTPTGDDTSISGRCADITVECCQYMNVPPAVLNNVIFCHQENSAWPLDEGKKLKERFDEIFDAQKYNKCVDLFRAKLKAKRDHMKVLDLELAYKRDQKDAVEKQKRVMQEKEDKLVNFEEDIRNKKEELEPMKKRLNEIFDLEQVLGDLQTQLTTKRTTKNGVVEEQNTIKKNLPFEFEGSDEELRAKIQSFENDRRKDESLIAELETRKNEIDAKNKKINDAIQETQTQLGQLNQQKTHFEEKCSERKNLLLHGKKEMNLTDLILSDGHDGARNALSELKMELETQDMCLSSLIQEDEDEQKMLQSAIDKAREKSVRSKQNITSKQEEAKQCEAKAEEISNQLITLSTSDDFMSTCQKKIDGIDKTLSNLKNSFRESEESQKMDNFRSDIQSKERTLESLEGDYRVLQQNDIIEGKMESEKHTIMEKQKEINRIKAKHSTNLKQLFGDAIPERNLKESVLSKQRNADMMMQNFNERIASKQKEVTTLEVQQKHQTEKISIFEKELRLNRNKISQACNGRDFNETLETTFQKKERLQVDKGQFSSVKIIYGQFINKFENEAPCCPICETDFSNKRGVVQKIVSALRNKLDRVPQELSRVETELQKEEALYSKLQQLKFVHEEAEQLSKEKIPDMRKQLSDIEQNLNRNVSELNELNIKLQEPRKIVEICKNLILDVGSLDQNQMDKEKSERALENLKLDVVQVASNKSKQEVEAEMDQLKSEVSELRSKIETQTKKINSHRDRLQQLMQERSSLVDRQMTLKENLQSRPLLEAQKTELEESVKKIREEVNKIQFELQLQNDELNNATENKQTVSKRNKQIIKEQRDKIETYKKIIQDIEKLQREIDDYIKNDVEEKLTTAENRLTEFRKKEKALEEAKTKIINAISEKREDLAKEELRFRTLKNNVTLREKKSAELKLEKEIEELKKQIGGYNYRTVHEEKIQLGLRRENLEKEINNLSGERNGLQTQINELRQELNKPANKKAYSNYMAKFYEKKIAEYVIQDMSKYNAALEKAIVDFHKSKMVQVNRTIRELWRNTYRGNDIDYIEIKTEHSSGSAARRSFNYKVVQIKKGVELDMRGRCSAGQKVLACLIIRMALAEIMSANCGILALDEPTTNLDRANIYSLCDTLTRIINARQAEKSFQLVIITHDEEFLNALTRVQGVSSYYKIKRNHEGFSVIEREQTGP